MTMNEKGSHLLLNQADGRFKQMTVVPEMKDGRYQLVASLTSCVHLSEAYGSK